MASRAATRSPPRQLATRNRAENPEKPSKNRKLGQHHNLPSNTLRTTTPTPVGGRHGGTRGTHRHTAGTVAYGAAPPAKTGTGNVTAKKQTAETVSCQKFSTTDTDQSRIRRRHLVGRGRMRFANFTGRAVRDLDDVRELFDI